MPHATLPVRCFTAVFLIINNSCTRSQRGRVNGLGMSTSSGFKAVGPTLGAVAFAWSLTNGHEAPLLNVYFTFLVCALLMISVAIVSELSFTAANDSPVAEEGEEGAADGMPEGRREASTRQQIVP